jgi:hypothetical protein
MEKAQDEADERDGAIEKEKKLRLEAEEREQRTKDEAKAREEKIMEEAAARERKMEEADKRVKELERMVASLTQAGLRTRTPSESQAGLGAG